MTSIHVDIVSAEAAIWAGSADMVFAPATEGDIGIAPRHAPLLTRLKPGEVRVKTHGGEELSFFISGGIIEVQPHVVTILTDTAVRAADLDEAGALQARQAAEEALANAESDIDLARAHAEMAEAAARLALVQKLRRK